MNQKTFFRWIGLFFSALVLLSTHTFADKSIEDKFQIKEVIGGLKTPWSMVELPEGELLITERSGSLQRISTTKKQPVSGLPEVYYAGQGGLLDIKLHPKYADNGWIYLSYAHGNKDENYLRVIRGKLKNNQFIDQQIIATVNTAKDTPVHYGGRMAFLPDNTFLLSSGDGFDFREHAQKKESLLGKMIRLNDDGSIPRDNPFYNDKAAHQSIFSLGHRNSQGLVYDKKRNLIFSNEHGPAGGDEINILEAGKNYGWPVITYGRDYSGASISPFTEYPGMEQPLVDWTPSIAPSSMVVYYGEMFPEFAGDILNTALKAKELRWVKMLGRKPTEQVSLLTSLNDRLRHIEIAQDGSLFVLTDSGKVLRISRK